MSVIDDPPLEVDFTRLDGWFHLTLGEWDVPRGPLGVFAYLPFVPLFWVIPPRALRAVLVATSLFVWYATLGPAFIAFLLVLLAYYFAVTRALAGSAGLDGRPARNRIFVAILLVHAPYAWLLFDPRPAFLPSMGDAIVVRTNYLHWCGLAYIHLKAVVVIVDRVEGRLARIAISDYLPFMLFAPTFKMGPLYRYDHFVSQLGDAKQHVQIGKGLVRIGIGLLRLGVMYFFFRKQIRGSFFTSPESLAYYKVLFSCAFKPLELYFWLAGYCDIAVGMGLMMGFRVPEQFRGPWFVNNIAEFWKRWSITLGRWLYDYPFRAMVAGRFPRSVCFVLTFLYCGLWHGLFRSYLIWGLSQGFGLAAYDIWHRWWQRCKRRDGSGVQLLRRLRICDSRLGWCMGWLVLVSYQFLTIAIASDLEHAGLRFVPVLFGLT